MTSLWPTTHFTYHPWTLIHSERSSRTECVTPRVAAFALHDACILFNVCSIIIMHQSVHYNQIQTSIRKHKNLFFLRFRLLECSLLSRLPSFRDLCPSPSRTSPSSSDTSWTRLQRHGCCSHSKLVLHVAASNQRQCCDNLVNKLD